MLTLECMDDERGAPSTLAPVPCVLQLSLDARQSTGGEISSLQVKDEGVQSDTSKGSASRWAGCPLNQELHSA